MNDSPGALIPRVRHAKDIDLSKADPNCTTCHGSGVSGMHQYTEQRKGFRPHEQEVAVVCKCVQNNGGVRPDGLDRLQSDQNSQQVRDRRERDRALDGQPVGTLEVQQRGGLNISDGTWVCSQCGVVLKIPLVSGPVRLPDGWRMAAEQAVCSDRCERDQQAQALIERIAREVSSG